MKAPFHGLAALLLMSLPAFAQSGPRIDAAEALAISEAAIGGQVGDHRLLRSDGTTLTLSELRGRPLVVSLIYTSCSTVCPVSTQTLKSSVAQARKALGSASFQIVTVGFDARYEIYAELQRIITTESPKIFTVQTPLYDVVWDHVQNWNLHPMGMFYMLDQVDIDR